MRPGDIVFTRPKSWIFNIIRGITKGKFGHVCIVTCILGDNVLVTEALFSGVDVNDFVWHKQAGESYIVYRNKMATEHLLQNVVKKAVSYHGTPYDKLPPLNWIIGRTCFGTDKAVYCSELIYRTFLEYKQIRSTFDPEKISPADLKKLMDSDTRYEVIEEYSSDD